MPASTTNKVRYGSGYLIFLMRKPVLEVSDLRANTNLALQPQKLARGMEFQNKKVKGFYYLCSENKGVGQSHGNRTADLCFWFAMCRKQVFS